MAFGTVGFATAITVLMALAPAGAGMLVHRNTVLSAPYKGTVASPNSFIESGGCATAKAAKSTWNAVTGTGTASMAATAKICAKTLAGVGSSSYGYAGDGNSIAIPFKVPTTGSHTILSTWTVTVSVSGAFTSGGCPGWTFTYPPASGSSQYGDCSAGNYLSMYMSSSVVDLNNASWYGNYSYLDSYNDSGWQNYTDCYNYSTPTCYNSSGAFGYSFTYGYNKAGMVTPGTPSTLMMWNNGTNMVKSHHYVLEISFSLFGEAFANSYNVISHWSGAASTAINMATLGNGAVLGSVSIT